MICIIKHRKSGKYIAGAIGKVLIHRGILAGWDHNKETVQFQLTTDILKARQIEDPDMDAVLSWGCEAIPLKITKAVLEQDYRIIEHEC